MNHHCHAGSGRSLDLRKWEEPGSVSSESPHLTSSLPSLSLPALYLLPGKALFLFPRYAILPLRPPVPVPTSSALAQLDCSRRQLPCVPTPMSQEQSPHRDARVYAKSAGVGSGAGAAGGSFGEGLSSNTLAPESERSWPSRQAGARWS